MCLAKADLQLSRAEGKQSDVYKVISDQATATNIIQALIQHYFLLSSSVTSRYQSDHNVQTYKGWQRGLCQV